MSRIKIIINTDNAAFDDGLYCHEIARILTDIKQDILQTCPERLEKKYLRDINGNRVGYICGGICSETAEDKLEFDR